MKFSILKASQQSNVKRVVSLLNTLASIRIYSLLQHSVVINHYVKQLNDPPVILAIPTFLNYSIRHVKVVTSDFTAKIEDLTSSYPFIKIFAKQIALINLQI